MIVSEDFSTDEFREFDGLHCINQSTQGLLTDRPTKWKRDRCRTMANKTNKIQIAVDVVIVIALIIILFVVLSKAQPTTRGFFCDDESIRYPHRSDTVTGGVLFGFLIIVVVIFFLIVEIVVQRKQKRFVLRALGSVGRTYGIYLFGLTVTMFITEVGKLTIGRLRPHFIDVCRPNFGNIDCTQGYIVNFNCTSGKPERLVIESRKSFPSGHSSMAFYCACFLAFYVHQRLRSRYSVLWRQLIQMLLCAAAVFTALSRVTDHKHHATDVLGGSAIGICVAVWAIMTLKRVVAYNHVDDVEAKDVHIQNIQGAHYDDTVEDPTFTQQTTSDIRNKP